MQEQYAPCDCPSCKTERERLNLADNPKEKTEFKKLLNIAEKAFKKLFEEKGYKPEDLFKNSEYQALANGTAELFNTAIPQHTSEDLKAYLEEDIFIFSQLKTHTQLTEARQYLKDEKGNIRSYHDFEQKIVKLNKQYNLNYLEAEYEFATHSAMSASNWANLQNDTERYWLEYRTAGDDRVRVSHQGLSGVCLPKDDAFWSEFYPPNGWRCRCVATEVLAREKTKSDSKKAIEQGQYATTHIGKNGKNKLAMFRFNPGIQKKMFPPNHSYKPKYCSNGKAQLNFESVFLSLEDERCKALKEIEEKAEKLKKERRKAKDKELKEWIQDNIKEAGNEMFREKFITQFIILKRSKLNNIVGHFTENRLKELVKDIHTIIDKAQYITRAPINPESHNYDKKVRQGVEGFTYYKLFHKGENIRLNCEIINGKEYPYSINIIIKEKSQ